MKKGFTHVPVLAAQSLHYLSIKPGGTYVDVTFGAGGHTSAILRSESTCRVIAIDWDKKVLDEYACLLKEEFGERFIPVWGNFAHIGRLLAREGVAAVDGILADFGLSQMQLRGGEGFSVYNDYPLDMRMSKAHQKITAAEVVNRSSAGVLEQIFSTFGEERHARGIANAIVEERKSREFITSRELALFIERRYPARSRSGIHPATRVFQALRIYVNKELENITSFLAGAMELLVPGGRVVCISFHSLEDRLVKQFFREREHRGEGVVVTDGAVMAAPEEVAYNPSSRSARLRAFEKGQSPG